MVNINFDWLQPELIYQMIVDYFWKLMRLIYNMPKPLAIGLKVLGGILAILIIYFSWKYRKDWQSLHT